MILLMLRVPQEQSGLGLITSHWEIKATGILLLPQFKFSSCFAVTKLQISNYYNLAVAATRIYKYNNERMAFTLDFQLYVPATTIGGNELNFESILHSVVEFSAIYKSSIRHLFGYVKVL